MNNLTKESNVNNINKYLTEKEVSEISSIALSTLRQDRFEGRGIPYVKLAKSVRYSLQDVIEYLESRKIQTHNEFGGRHHDCNK